MAEKVYDLGENYDDKWGGPIGEPEEDEEKIWYPTIHLEGKDFKGFPDSGEAVVKFKLKERSETKRNDDKPEYRIVLELHTICPKKSGEGSGSEKDSDDDEIEKGLQEAEKRKK